MPTLVRSNNWIIDCDMRKCLRARAEKISSESLQMLLLVKYNFSQILCITCTCIANTFGDIIQMNWKTVTSVQAALLIVNFWEKIGNRAFIGKFNV